MPRAGSDAAARATAHLLASMQYKRRGNTRKSEAHFGRVLAYGSRSSALAFGVAPTSIGEVHEDCSQHITWTWDKSTHIASGRQGTVRIATLAHDRNDYVVKQQTDSYQFEQEVRALIDLQKTTVVPKLHAAWRCDGQGYIVMEKLEPVTLNNGAELERAWSEIGTMLDRIRAEGWMHVDTHGGNVMRTKEGRLVFVDFGLGVKTTSEGDTQMYPSHFLSKTALLFATPPTWAELKTYQDYMYQRNYNPASPANACTDPLHDRNAKPTQRQVDAYVSAYRRYWRMIRSLSSRSRFAHTLYDKEDYDDGKKVNYNGSDNESAPPIHKNKRLPPTPDEPDTDAKFQRGVSNRVEDALMHLRSELGSCLSKVSSLLSPKENRDSIYPKTAMDACEKLIIQKFQSGDSRAPPGSSERSWAEDNMGRELGKILSESDHAGLEIKDEPEHVLEGGYEKVIVKFADPSKRDLKTQMVVNITLAGAVIARGLEWEMYKIYLCTDSNVYWKGWGTPSIVSPPP